MVFVSNKKTNSDWIRARLHETNIKIELTKFKLNRTNCIIDENHSSAGRRCGRCCLCSLTRSVDWSVWDTNTSSKPNISPNDIYKRHTHAHTHTYTHLQTHPHVIIFMRFAVDLNGKCEDRFRLAVAWTVLPVQVSSYGVPVSVLVPILCACAPQWMNI